jgi:hypothetical protein
MVCFSGWSGRWLEGEGLGSGKEPLSLSGWCAPPTAGPPPPPPGYPGPITWLLRCPPPRVVINIFKILLNFAVSFRKSKIFLENSLTKLTREKSVRKIYEIPPKNHSLQKIQLNVKLIKIELCENKFTTVA